MKMLIKIIAIILSIIGFSQNVYSLDCGKLLMGESKSKTNIAVSLEKVFRVDFSLGKTVEKASVKDFPVSYEKYTKLNAECERISAKFGFFSFVFGFFSSENDEHDMWVDYLNSNKVLNNSMFDLVSCSDIQKRLEIKYQNAHCSYKNAKIRNASIEQAEGRLLKLREHYHQFSCSGEKTEPGYMWVKGDWEGRYPKAGFNSKKVGVPVCGPGTLGNTGYMIINTSHKVRSVYKKNAIAKGVPASQETVAGQWTAKCVSMSDPDPQFKMIVESFSRVKKESKDFYYTKEGVLECK
ncbi:hypothetical protein A9Q99_02205 [Gammaproteobacteria bacterium 45_16_T64]|nr:hypothetical protein A9Q99_02205 [Gammaproteobacteria bacterium 45_16_T64]